jgi:subfamily B ATP-binding cassette protein MsbA
MIKEILKKNELFSGLRQMAVFLNKTGISWKFFALSLSFSLGLTLFNLYTVALLFPLAQGIINGNFYNVRDLPLIGAVANAWPGRFASSLSLFALLVFWIYANIILKNALLYLSRVSNGRQARTATINMRQLLFTRCLSFSKSFYDRRQISDIHRIITRSSAVISEQFHSLQGFIVSSCLIIMYFGAMLHLSWKLCLVAAISFPLLNSLTKKIIARIRSYTKKSDELEISLANRLFDVLAGMPIVKAFTQERREEQKYQEANRQGAEEEYHAKKIFSLLEPLEDISVTTSILFLAFGMMFVIYVDKSLAAASAFVFFYLAQNLIGKLNSLNGFKVNIIRSTRMVNDINDLLENNNEHLIPDGRREFLGLKEGIRIEGLDFSYGDDPKKALSGLSLEIPAGKMTAIVGPTGSGKSTLASLLLRFYDCPAKKIMVDGVDLRDLQITGWRKRLAFIGQDGRLFNASVKENVAYGQNDDCSEAEIIAACQKAAADNFINLLPAGYDTVIGENGTSLSGGERQRLAIARALIRPADILIMDEATSALDPITEKKVMEAIRQEMSGKTLLVISHRLAAIKAADKIFFIEAGRVAESGSFNELLEKRGRFYEAWKTQEY